MCHVSHVTFLFYIVVELVGGVSVINGATLSSFFSYLCFGAPPEPEEEKKNSAYGRSLNLLTCADSSTNTKKKGGMA